MDSSSKAGAELSKSMKSSRETALLAPLKHFFCRTSPLGLRKKMDFRTLNEVLQSVLWKCLWSPQLWGLVKRVEEIRLEAFLCVTILGNRMSSSVWLVRIPSFFGGPRIEKSVPHPMENYRWPCCFDHWKPRTMLLRPCSSQTKSLSHFLHHFSKLLHSVRK